MIDFSVFSLLKDVDDEVNTRQKNLVKLKDEGKVMGRAFDLCEKSVDVSLKSIGVERQAYYGGTIIGNQCHKLLKPKNVDVLCAATNCARKNWEWVGLPTCC